MGAINSLLCGSGTGGNTGVANCYADPKNITGAILTPVGYTITDAQIISGLLTKLQTDILADRSARIYPLNGFVGITDNSEDATTETLGYGDVDYVREGFNNWLLRFKRGGVCLNAQLRRFNNQALGVLFVDSAGVLWGERTSTGVRALDLATIFTPAWKVNTGAATTVYSTRLVFDAVGLNDRPGFIGTSDLGFSIKSLMGLINVAVSKVTRVTNVLTVRLLAGCGQTNLFDQYSGVLNAPGAWVARNASTGNLINISSVSADSNTSGFIVTLDTTDPDYVAGAPVTLSLAAPAVLAANPYNVTGYESNVATITV